MKSDKNKPLPNPNTRHIVVSFKVNAEEMRRILRNAGAFTSRNVSQWARIASQKFRPAKGDL